ncbi:methylated-DNA--[protein]-cysteine S-methyltransferase [Helicobacter pylori]|uniref:methylated-DNA--[protein]-cysteine S-methyltransferase n=1 Tax=Helicobacter pylori TaxID=210 RepID=UPI00112A6601|nr:methylated-DNA--[protein]-cysteine S-methyltransferase [Helicobacter pylori]TPH31568.1 methylated-DNA--[protein]-cysteine S-methyltransferase [Helicobacter pylori]
MVLYHYYFKTPKSFPLEYLHLCANESHLLRLDFDAVHFSHNTPMNTPLELSVQALERYFLGQLFEFNAPLDLIGTSFQKQVWSALMAIPYGKTKSYDEIAISLIVPCHRVVRKNGALGGYNGGIEVKKWLLEFESKILNQQAKNSLIS